MRVSLLHRRHRALVLAGATLVAGLLLAAPGPSLLVLACGLTVLGLARRHREGTGGRRRQEAALGDFGYLEAVPGPAGRRDGA